MAAVGGDIQEITFNHPTIGTGTWFVKSGEDSTFDIGGVRKTDDSNMITGNGIKITQMNRVPWKVTATVVWDSAISNELDKANLIAGSPVECNWTFTLANGTVWAGTGSIVGDIEGNANEATFEATFSGGGDFKKIVG